MARGPVGVCGIAAAVDVLGGGIGDVPRRPLPALTAAHL